MLQEVPGCPSSSRDSFPSQAVLLQSAFCSTNSNLLTEQREQGALCRPRAVGPGPGWLSLVLLIPPWWPRGLSVAWPPGGPHWDLLRTSPDSPFPGGHGCTRAMSLLPVVYVNIHKRVSAYIPSVISQHA